MREPINISVPYRALSPEDEAFNDIERRSKVKQEIINNPSQEAKLRIEVASKYDDRLQSSPFRMEGSSYQKGDGSVRFRNYQIPSYLVLRSHFKS